MNNTLHTRLLQVYNMLKSKRLGTMPSVIKIETSTACNRRCWYCPQSVKPMKQQVISAAVWDQFKFRLTEYNYRGLVGLTYYNEFSLIPDCERYVAEISALNCKPLIFSNGDKPDKLLDCLRAGAHHIIITEHPPHKPGWLEDLQPLRQEGGKRVSIQRLTKFMDHAGQVVVNTPKPTYCVSPIAEITIGIEGQYALCPLDYGAKYGRKATIFSESFDTHWKADRKARQLLRRGIPTTALCKNCIAPRGNNSTKECNT